MRINENVCRLTTSYKDIFTTIYSIRTPEGVLIFDAASYDTDISEHLIPFLSEYGIALEEVKAVFISHNHRDHAGGLAEFAVRFPEARIISRSSRLKEQYGDRVLCLEDGEELMGVLQVVTIPGHTVDSAGVLDTRSGMLISGDSLQLYGIFGTGKWAANINLPDRHLEALKKLEAMEISEILTAHNYHPCGFRYVGKEQILLALRSCREPLEKVKELLLASPEKSDEEITAAYNASGTLPTLGTHVVTAVRQSDFFKSNGTDFFVGNAEK